MQQRYLLLICCVCFLSLKSFSQEYHWTLYNMAPLTVNPAKTGDFYGTFRVGGIFRNQFSGVTNKAYNTPMLYLDAPLIKGLRDQDWIGVGVVLVQDKAGYLGFKTTYLYMSAAYHLSFNKKQTSLLSLGFQTGSVSRKLNMLSPDEDIFGDEFTMGGNSIDRSKLSTEGQSVTEYAGGIQLKVPLGATSRLTLGTRVGHLTKNMNLSVAGGTNDLPTRITGHGKLDILMKPGFILSPSFLFESYGEAGETLAQVEGRFLLNEEKNIEFLAGVGYRLGDAAQALIGLQIGDIKVAMGFDITTSSLSQASNFGGFEIAASYIAKIYKKPKLDPVIFCPRF